jgi:hypothetical protein
MQGEKKDFSSFKILQFLVIKTLDPDPHGFRSGGTGPGSSEAKTTHKIGKNFMF